MPRLFKKGQTLRLQARPEIIQPEDSKVRLIPLTQDQVAIVDAMDYEWLSERNWHAWWSPSTRSFYAVSSGPLDTNGRQKPISMGRFILSAPVGSVVDHRNHNTLDNRRSNLRLANYSQNSFNARQHKNGVTGVKGVTINRYGKYMARVCLNGKRWYLGNFDSLEQAARARESKELELAGEFSILVSRKSL